jgi:DNA-binding NarL/FixJ family response regulator
MRHPEGSGGAIRVVLADDEPSFLEALRPLIDYQPELAVVGSAADGLAAIELVDELLPDAVVIDLHMPRLDGVSAVARLRKDHPSICLVALTGDPAPALHRAVTDAGADAVLLKDEFIDALIERLSAIRAPAPAS